MYICYLLLFGWYGITILNIWIDLPSGVTIGDRGGKIPSKNST